MEATGYGQSAEEVGRVRATAELLTGYQDAVHEATVGYLPPGRRGLRPRRRPGWDPPVTLAVRLVSVLDDTLEHAGQASYVRGLIERRG